MPDQRLLRSVVRHCAAAVLASLLVAPAYASISYNTTGSTYTENFDSLPNTPANTSLGSTPIGWTDDNVSPGAGNFSIVGWYLRHSTTQTEGGFNGNQRMRIGAGTVNTGAFMSFGASGSTERALGTLGSSTLMGSGGHVYYAARLTNNTTDTLDSFTLSYTAEEWRDGGNSVGGSVAQAVTFGYKVNAANIQDTGFTDIPELGFTSPTFGALAGAALDGNLSTNQVPVSFTVTGANWQPGTDLWLRWFDTDHPSNDHGLAIDNLSFTAAIPEPASLGLLALGALGLIRRRR